MSTKFAVGVLTKNNWTDPVLYQSTITVVYIKRKHRVLSRNT